MAYSPEKSCRFEGMPEDTFTVNCFVRTGTVTEVIKCAVPKKETEV